MTLNVLFVGGTGQISLPCVELAIAAGHKVSVFNRGQRAEPLPKGAISIIGDMKDPQSYAQLGQQHWDVVNQFMVFTPEQMQQDIATFSGKVGQYIFISSASVYQKHPFAYMTSEATTPAVNPWWPYSQAKIACENLMKASSLPWTNVRPSHTTRTGLPTMLNEGDSVALRMLAGKPVLVAGDGTAIWTLTRSEDFAKPYVKLFANPAALKEDFHITGDVGFTWDAIYMSIAKGLGVEAKLAHVPTDTLIRYKPDWAGPLLGDKTWTTLFDNSKIKRVAGDFSCETDLDKILVEPIRFLKQRLAAKTPVNQELDPLIDRICAEQAALGA
ncbi:NAD-dependent epimerase/dehydratase family protein [Devosia sp.]|jgi:nucleoside-diphosphate-sugar epimerase|uniref:NAD-dependent epimerase/dehydratase family protein n=1 Tax=Devosia sp. TaxID=1871048 RepID=UPI0037C097FD